MSLLSAVIGGTSTRPDLTPGHVAAWALTFHPDSAGALGEPLLTVGSDSYDGSIAATLPQDLAGGTYEATIEGLTDQDYAVIRNSRAPLAARLYLWWKDSPSGVLGDLANFTGLTDRLGSLTAKPPGDSLVAELRVDRLARRAGERRYDVVVTLSERVFARLSETRVAGRCYAGLKEAVGEVGKAAGVTVTALGLEKVPPSPDNPDFASVQPGPGTAALTGTGHLLEQVAQALRLYGPSPVLLRDGTLLVGKWTDSPLVAARTLDEGTGLVSVQRSADHPAQGGKPAKSANGEATARATVTLVALGRPDIKPGDTVSVQLPEEDFPEAPPRSLGAAILTTLTGMVPGGLPGLPTAKPSRCLVTGVAHRISRRSGFVSTITAVVLTGTDDSGWDAKPSTGDLTPPTSGRPRGGPAPDSAQATAQVIRDALAARQTGARVGQIRSHPASVQVGASPPRHTSEVWYADVAGDGLPAAAQRVPITADHHAEQREVPTLSPFAWGPYGLVVPRYPGTRVLLADAGGGANDLVDVGALWGRDEGPPAEAGDYWLVLPIGAPNTEDIGDSDGTAPGGPASHDLIEADGTRIIETTRFIIRVTDHSTEAGERPEPSEAPSGGVMIQAKGSDSATISLAPNGAITVSGTSIAFSAGSGDISLTAANVRVKVTGTMDVS